MIGVRQAVWCASVIALVAGCDAEPRPHLWRVAFDDDATRDASQLVEVQIRTGGCDGEVVFQTVVRRDAEGMPAPALSPGIYGVEATAFDGACGIVASQCVEVELPRDPAEVDIVLADGGRMPCGGMCTDGVCVPCGPGGCEMDAGPDPDGGLDAGPDGGTDAGPIDAGPIDGGPPGAPRILAPWSGVMTGSALASDSAAEGPMEHPLRPLVAWEAVDGAGGYRVQWAPCSGVDVMSCDFGAAVVSDVGADAREARPSASLTVETVTPPLGARWAVRVGACLDDAGTGCAFSAARYLDVGRTRGDVDGDGDADLFFVQDPSSGDEELRRVTGMSGFATAAVRTEPTLRRVAWIGDIDGDGFGELALATLDAVLVLDDAAGTATVAGSISMEAPSELAAAGDVDGDGFADFAFEAGSNVYVRLGGASFEDGVQIEMPTPTGVTELGARISRAGDRNGDGLADIVIAGRVAADTVELRFWSLAGRVATPIGDPEIIATGETGVATGFPIELAGGFDMDGDGTPEVAVLRRLSDVLTVFFDGRRESTEFGVFGTSRNGALAMGALDGTRRGRVVVGSPEFEGALGATGRTYHVRHSGDPFAITGIAYFNEDRFGERVAVGDFDADGFEDFASLSAIGRVIHFGTFGDGSVGGTSSFVFAPGSGLAVEISR
ncbi:MAG: FG-GAP repeat domain-containing protein [Sandaracinaceae bacterium]